jgi:hypothetical protein
MPRADVVFPLPLPVITTTSPLLSLGTNRVISIAVTSSQDAPAFQAYSTMTSQKGNMIALGLRPPKRVEWPSVTLIIQL